MIPADLKARIDALSGAELAEVIRAARAPMLRAMEAFEAGTIGERELIAVGLAVNSTLRGIVPGAAYEKLAETTDRKLRERISELDAEAA